MDIPPGFIPTFHEDSAFQPTISLVQTLLNMRVVQTTIVVKRGAPAIATGVVTAGVVLPTDTCQGVALGRWTVVAAADACCQHDEYHAAQYQGRDCHGVSAHDYSTASRVSGAALALTRRGLMGSACTISSTTTSRPKTVALPSPVLDGATLNVPSSTRPTWGVST